MERRFQDVGQMLSAAAHIVVGLLFAGDGIQKLVSALDGTASGVSAAIVGLAGALELIGGVLVAARSRAILVSTAPDSWPGQPFARSATTSSKL